MRKINSLDNILSGLKKKDSEPGVDLKEFTIVLKNKQTKQSFVDDMESQSTNILSETIPSRSCKSLISTNNNRKVLKYRLTKEEANLLERDSRVECVEQYIEKKIKPLVFKDEATLSKPFDYVKNQDSENQIKIQSKLTCHRWKSNRAKPNLTSRKTATDKSAHCANNAKKSNAKPAQRLNQ